MKKYNYYTWKSSAIGGFNPKRKHGKKWILWKDVKKLLQKLGYIEKVKPE